MKDKLTPVLVVLLAVAAFAIGSMWTQLRQLKTKNGQAAQPQVAGEKQNQPSEQQAQAPEMAPLSDEDWQKVVVADGGAVKGSEDAPVTIVEFSEYLCPFCAEYAGFDAIPSRDIDEGQTLQKITQNYIDSGKVRYIFRDLTIHGEKAIKASEAAHCAGDQDAYWQYHDVLFENQQAVYEAEDQLTYLEELAGDIDLDTQAFSSCLTEGKYADRVEANFELGKSIGANSTPSFFINGEKLLGAQPYEKFEENIEEQLK